MSAALPIVQQLDWGRVEWLWLPGDPVGPHVAVSMVDLAPGRSIMPHVHLGEEQLIVVLQGQGSDTSQAKPEHLAPGKAYRLAGDCRHEMLCTPGSALRFIVIARAVRSGRLPVLRDANFLGVVELFARHTGLGVCVVSPDGHCGNFGPYRSTFCNLVCTNSDARAICRRKLSRGAARAYKLQRAFPVTCCFPGTLSIVMPAPQHMGQNKALVCGPMLVNRIEATQLEQFLTDMRSQDAGELRRALDKIPQAPVYRLWTAATALHTALQPRAPDQPTTPQPQPSSSAPPGRGLDTRLVVEAIQRFLETASADQMNLTQVSKHLHMNPSHLSRVFPRWMGHSFGEYVRRLKMERAKRLLETNDAPVHRIAAACGYRDVCHFERVFRAHVGLSPNTYRRLSRAEADDRVGAHMPREMRVPMPRPRNTGRWTDRGGQRA
ncbi:MAG: helix-turn-helix domain-containing protein [Synergistales bacterium]|nr:helix-turn-helix domain-containing protein [Synergistales bacterium]